MSVERTIANFLRIAQDDLKGARLLADAGNRNAAYLAEQAAEKVIRAVLTSEGLHAGVRHDLREMVGQVPKENPVRPLLEATTVLSMYATSFRYPGTSNIPAEPSTEALKAHLRNVEAAFEAAVKGFGVDLASRTSGARRPGPLR